MRRSGLAFVLYAALSCAVAVSVWEQVRPVAAERADQVRTTSEKALVRPNRIDELLRVLDDGDSVEIVHAGVALSLLLIDAPDNKRQTRVWLALRDGDASTLLDYLQKPDTRLVALKLVSALQTNNARFGPALIALVEDENPRVRETVAATLGVLDATPEIVRALF